MSMDSHEAVYNVDENRRCLWIVVYGRGNNESVNTHDIGLQWIHNESVYTKSVYNGHVSKSVL
jgi:hypothetical protein